MKRITRHTPNVLNDEDRIPADDVGGDAVVGGLGGGGVLGVATGVGTTLQIPGPLLPYIFKKKASRAKGY